MQKITMEDLFVAIKDVAQDVSSLDSRVGNLEKEMKNMRTDIQRIDKKLNNFNNDLGDVRAEISILQEKTGMN
ncbi:hypothetical protein [Virgibacillus doumboii]|uniref:hypothetical protein n=1 Tax=Virgibacillus doumboii TaxID=2697503 RepID=UPI0013DEF0D5|nr:hypothetical protein [Virgibacillus doumboii]